MPAARPAAAASGSASPPARTCTADAMTIFCLRQITPHTFTNMMRAMRMPVEIDTPFAALAEVVVK